MKDETIKEILNKLAERLKDIDDRLVEITKQSDRDRWYLDELMKKIDPKWESLSQD